MPKEDFHRFRDIHPVRPKFLTFSGPRAFLNDCRHRVDNVSLSSAKTAETFDTPGYIQYAMAKSIIRFAASLRKIFSNQNLAQTYWLLCNHFDGVALANQIEGSSHQVCSKHQDRISEKSSLSGFFPIVAIGIDLQAPQ